MSTYQPRTHSLNYSHGGDSRPASSYGYQGSYPTRRSDGYSGGDDDRLFVNGRVFKGPGYAPGLDKVTSAQRAQNLARAAAAVSYEKGKNTGDSGKAKAQAIYQELRNAGHFKSVRGEGYSKFAAQHVTNWKDNSRTKARANRLIQANPSMTEAEAVQKLYTDYARRKNFSDALKGVDGAEKQAKAKAKLAAAGGDFNKALGLPPAPPGEGRKKGGKKGGNNKANGKAKGPKPSSAIRKLDQIAKPVNPNANPAKKLSLFNELVQRALRNHLSLISHPSPVLPSHINLAHADKVFSFGGQPSMSRANAANVLLKGTYDKLQAIAAMNPSRYQKLALSVVLTSERTIKERFTQYMTEALKRSVRSRRIPFEDLPAWPETVVPDISYQAFVQVGLVSETLWRIKAAHSFGLKLDAYQNLFSDSEMARLFNEVGGRVKDMKAYKDWVSPTKDQILQDVMNKQIAELSAVRSLSLFTTVFGMLADVVTVLQVGEGRKNVLLANFARLFVRIWNSPEATDAGFDEDYNKFNAFLQTIHDGVNKQGEPTLQAANELLLPGLPGLGEINVVSILRTPDLGTRFPKAMQKALAKTEEYIIPAWVRALPEVQAIRGDLTHTFKAPTPSADHAAVLKMQVLEKGGTVFSAFVTQRANSLTPSVGSTGHSAREYLVSYKLKMVRGLTQIGAIIGTLKSPQVGNRLDNWALYGFLSWPVADTAIQRSTVNEFSGGLVKSMQERLAVTPAGVSMDFRPTQFYEKVVESVRAYPAEITLGEETGAHTAVFVELQKHIQESGKAAVGKKGGKSGSNVPKAFRLRLDGEKAGVEAMEVIGNAGAGNAVVEQVPQFQAEPVTMTQVLPAGGVGVQNIVLPSSALVFEPSNNIPGVGKSARVTGVARRAREATAPYAIRAPVADAEEEAPAAASSEEVARTQ